MTKSSRKLQPPATPQLIQTDDSKTPVDQGTPLLPHHDTPLDHDDDLVVDASGEPAEEDLGSLFNEQEIQDTADNGGHTLPDED